MGSWCLLLGEWGRGRVGERWDAEVSILFYERRDRSRNRNRQKNENSGRARKRDKGMGSAVAERPVSGARDNTVCQVSA